MSSPAEAEAEAPPRAATGPRRPIGVLGVLLIVGLFVGVGALGVLAGRHRAPPAQSFPQVGGGGIAVTEQSPWSQVSVPRGARRLGLRDAVALTDAEYAGSNLVIGRVRVADPATLLPAGLGAGEGTAVRVGGVVGVRYGGIAVKRLGVSPAAVLALPARGGGSIVAICAVSPEVTGDCEHLVANAALPVAPRADAGKAYASTLAGVMRGLNRRTAAAVPGRAPARTAGEMRALAAAYDRGARELTSIAAPGAVRPLQTGLATAMRRLAGAERRLAAVLGSSSRPAVRRARDAVVVARSRVRADFARLRP